jgi:hypothetical protein
LPRGGTAGVSQHFGGHSKAELIRGFRQSNSFCIIEIYGSLFVKGKIAPAANGGFSRVARK